MRLTLVVVTVDARTVTRHGRREMMNEPVWPGDEIVNKCSLNRGVMNEALSTRSATHVGIDVDLRNLSPRRRGWEAGNDECFGDD